MIIKDFHFKNKYLYFNDLAFDFSQCGIYLLSGENGCGKTTLMKEIVFGKNYQVVFSDDDNLKAWKKDRSGLFSYISQDYFDNKMKVYEYIAFKNKQISYENTTKLFFMFSLDISVLQQPFNTLSGGEKKKIQIISGLLKNTPYYFFDEPTNNMDDDSVKQFSIILAELAKEKTIVLISHDDRLKIEVNSIYSIKHNNIEFELRCNKPVNRDKAKIFSTNILSIVARFTFTPIQIITFVLTMISVVLCVFYSYSFCVDKLPYTSDIKKDVIISSSLGTMEDNKEFIEYENLHVPEENVNNYLSLNNVTPLYNMESVDKIYIVDECYSDQFTNKLLDNTIGEAVNYFSMPELIFDYYDQTVIDIGNIDSRMFPKDNSFEVAISENILKKFFSYSTEQIIHAIGTKIELSPNGQTNTYTIIGLLPYDYALISFTENNDCGVYTVNKDTFLDFGNQLIEYQQKNGRLKVGQLSSVIITTKADKEKEILTYLITNSPDCDYQSSYMNKCFMSIRGRNAFLIGFSIDIGVSLVLALAIYFLNRKSVEYNMGLLNEYNNYYLNPLKYNGYYYYLSFLFYFALSIALIVSSFLFDKPMYALVYSIISCVIVLFSLAFLYFGRHLIKRRK